MSATNSARFICVSALHTVPFANLNRDDTNSVKTVQFGGVLRTRISSQCWKRPVRLDFEHRIGQTALRTRRIGERVARLLTDERGWSNDHAARAGAHLAAAAGITFELGKEVIEDDKGSKTTKVVPNIVFHNSMVYAPDTTVSALADVAEEFRERIESAQDITTSADTGVLAPKKKQNGSPAEKIQGILRSTNGVINTFGRMLTEVDGAAVDGAVQVAHAMTTHATDVEIDYFSAVDDVTALWQDSTGSGHMGHAEFSTGTFYRYATIDLAQLAHNLKGDVAAVSQLAETFLHSFVKTMPEAKKNSTAPHTPPDLVHITVRADRPLSLAAAFEKPVRAANEGGYAAASRDALAKYAEAVNEFMGSDGILSSGWTGLGTKDLAGFGERNRSLDGLITSAARCAFGKQAAA
ncbi:type I-E CRISPR-associated protein Cas7/Cse4/CasC [Streptomyces sp. P38-E01]|uniref:Type I-E CRISPR-associated protein Cas7/Cse4/CasC n=1 Tax=Streptomyces tardus TaxID=2780544 RepID=A0A949JF30_9ACTN|nr:type I-E CRISPR-associated protein Cas7/Cse4/CasC [Streptomyces tardus]MBU7598913.1 type I-E CRISPR-associated protein Cas7/Cse4/CasC [Streptomyces tardus]